MASPVLTATRVAFAYHPAVPVLVGATFSLRQGWTGLVGENGSGKSTLLRLLARELRPTEGELRWEPRSARVAVCPQRVESASPELLALAADLSGDACRLRARLGLEPAALQRFERLSPGERRRWQVAAALHSQPDLLLLDEPTNHLDAETRRWLVGALRSTDAAGVVVSHDRALLDALTHTTLRVHRGEVTESAGGYTQARASWEAALSARLSERARRQQEEARQRQELAQRRRDQEAASRQRSAGQRMKDRNDSDARGALANGRAARAAQAHGRRVAATRHQLARAEEALAAVALERQLGSAVFVGFERARRPVLLQTVGPLRLPCGRTLPTVPPVARDDRIWLAGRNGAGKSSLLAALLQAAPNLDRDALLVLPQALTAAEEQEGPQALRALPADVRGRALSLVAALGADPDRLLATEQPSPGEARKLWIARGLAERRALLVLDEPENHLDLPSVERLQEALSAYPGALLLVSHDERFARAVTTTRWALVELAPGRWDLRVEHLSDAPTSARRRSSPTA